MRAVRSWRQGPGAARRTTPHTEEVRQQERLLEATTLAYEHEMAARGRASASELVFQRLVQMGHVIELLGEMADIARFEIEHPPEKISGQFGTWTRSARRPLAPYATFTDTVKAMPRISAKNQVTLPVAALEEAGLRAGEQVSVEPTGDGELRLRRATLGFDDAFGVLTGSFPPGYLDRLDAEDERH